jgi:hypothetical protein
MNQKEKALALKKYASLAGQPIGNIMTELAKLEPTMKDEDLEDLASSLATVDTKPQDKKKPASTSLNKLFEEFIVEPKYKDHAKTRGSEAWRELVGFDKLRKIKDVRITPDRAELLNAQSEQSKIRYYPDDLVIQTDLD